MPTTTTPRKPRCRVLTRRRNPCPNEAVSEFGLCAHHLAAAAAEYRAVLAQHRKQSIFAQRKAS